MEQTISELVASLAEAKVAYKLSATGGTVFLCVDGFMDSLRR